MSEKWIGSLIASDCTKKQIDSLHTQQHEQTSQEANLQPWNRGIRKLPTIQPHLASSFMSFSHKNLSSSLQRDKHKLITKISAPQRRLPERVNDKQSMELLGQSINLFKPHYPPALKMIAFNY